MTMETANAFGASVDLVQNRDVGLYLVIGSEEAPTVVRSNQGRVVTTLGDGRFLAVMTFPSSAAVQQHHEINLCGPVTVDAHRFNSFVSAVGLQDPP